MTKPTQRILFLVNGLGMGNSTRCDSIIQALISRGYLIDILTSGNGLDYFRTRRPYVSQIFQLQSFYYGSKGGKLNIWRTIAALPYFVKIYKNNARQLMNLITSDNYGALVIDSDYTVLRLKKHIRIPVIALNNAGIVIEECKKLSALPREIRMQYWIEKCDDWFHRKYPDLVLSPAIHFRRENGRSPRYFAPFVREELKVRPPDLTLRNVLVMLSGSQFKSSTDFLHILKPRDGVQIDVVGREGESKGWITYHGKLFNNQHLVNQADMMVVNGGFSAVSEAVVLRKPVVVIPVENHAEQFINARVVEYTGLGLAATMENVVSKMTQVMDLFPDFVKNHSKFGCDPDGAQKAAEVIDEVVRNGSA